MPGVNLFSGNELDPTDQPDAVLIFGGDGTIHRHLGGLALKQIPTLVVPIGSANDFAQSIGMSGYAIDDVISTLVDLGMSTRDIGHLEKLDDPKISGFVNAVGVPGA